MEVIVLNNFGFEKMASSLHEKNTICQIMGPAMLIVIENLEDVIGKWSCDLINVRTIAEKISTAVVGYLHQ
ncbi:MAG: hypothetical protein PVG14_19375 [Anaerolineales bacterium]|jgi:hypothetical protein